MIAGLFRYSVKSMRGEALLRARLKTHGIEGDRARALVDVESGRIVSAKYPRRWGRMLTLAARAVAGSVAVSFPNGEVVSTQDPRIDEKLSTYLGRAVHLSSRPPDEITIERADPTIAGVFLAESNREVTESRLHAPTGTFFDYAPVHIVTTATLARLHQLSPQSQVDVARFRPNLVVDLPGGTAFEENDWAGARMYIGSSVVLALDVPTPRCAIPTLAQGGLPRDDGILQCIARHNRIAIEGVDSFACLGGYARVLNGGDIAVGDNVRVYRPY